MMHSALSKTRSWAPALGLSVGLGVGLACMGMAAAGCQPKYGPRSVSLRLSGKPKGAMVTVDDQPVGPLAYVASRGVALPPGKHRISVEKRGFFPYDVEVTAVEAPIVLKVKLRRIPE